MPALAETRCTKGWKQIPRAGPTLSKKGMGEGVCEEEPEGGSVWDVNKLKSNNNNNKYTSYQTMQTL